MTLIAHAGGYWIDDIVLGGPALAFGAWLLISQARERLKARARAKAGQSS